MIFRCDIRVWNEASRSYRPLSVYFTDLKDVIALKEEANEYGYFDEFSIEKDDTFEKAWEKIMKLRRE